MSLSPDRRGKVLSQAALALRVKKLQSQGRKIVFTNGCFDLLHVGHVRYLRAARDLGDVLVVAVNSDASLRRLKGPPRPVTPEKQRLEVLAALECVDYLCLFGGETPLGLIRRIGPDVLVKGGDWPVEKIVGRDVVEERGGRVVSIPLVRGVSTTEILRRLGEPSGTAEAHGRSASPRRRDAGGLGRRGGGKGKSW